MVERLQPFVFSRSADLNSKQLLGGNAQETGSKQERDKLINVNRLPAMDLQPVQGGPRLSVTAGDGHQPP